MTPRLARSVLVVTFVVAVAAALGIGRAVEGGWSLGALGGAPEGRGAAAPEDGPPPPARTASGAPDGVPAGAQRAEVDRVVDGDTLRVAVVDAGGPLPVTASAPVRLLNVDTPETRHPSRGVECGGPEATAFVERLLPPGTTVWLVSDRSDTDRYGRALRAVWTDDGTFLNGALVDAGLATAVLFPPDDRWYDDLLARETAARAAGVGNWSRCP